jgi:hypothetical protein
MDILSCFIVEFCLPRSTFCTNIYLSKLHSLRSFLLHFWSDYYTDQLAILTYSINQILLFVYFFYFFLIFNQNLSLINLFFLQLLWFKNKQISASYIFLNTTFVSKYKIILKNCKFLNMILYILNQTQF